MKSLKKFLAVMLAVALVLSSMAVAFAQDDPLAEKYPEAALMRDLGILKGASQGVTEAYLQQRPVRIQAAILTLRMLGKEEEALAYSGLARFEDKLPDGYWAKPVLGYLKNNPGYGWYGDDQGKFNPEQPIRKEEFAKVLLKAMGYDQGTHYEWEGVMTAYKVAGLTYLLDADPVITMLDIALAINEALTKPVRGSTTTLADKIASVNPAFKEAALAKGLIKPVTISKVDNPNLGSVSEGAIVYPPAQVLATMSDGTTKMVDVQWEVDKFDTSEPGEVSIKGKVEGFSGDVTATLTVVAAEIVEVADIEFEDVYVGQDVVLPDTVEAVFSNGKVAEVPVTWEPAEVDTSEPAELTFVGKVEGYDGEVIATMKVLPDEIAEVAIEDIAIDAGSELELPEEVEVTYKSGKVETVAVTWNTEAVKIDVPGTYEVVGTIGEYEFKVNVEVKAVAFAVTDVIADNLKSFTVKFNKEVSSVTVADAASVVILADKKTAVGYWGTALTQSKNVTFTISAKSVAGEEIKDYKVSKVVNDTTVPSFVGARALNPKQVELQFSEPVNFDYPLLTLLTDVKVDGVASIAKALPNYINNTVVLEYSAALSAGTHTISVAKVRDFANFEAPAAEYTISVVEDKEAPKAISAEIKSKYLIEVTFDEPLSVLGSFTVDGVPASAAFVANSNNTKVNVTVPGSGLGIGAIVEVKVGYVGQKDVMGNEVKSTTIITTKTTDDTTLPTVSLSVSTGNKVTLTFSKPMMLVGTIKLYDKDNKELKSIDVSTLSFKADSGNKVLELSATTLGLGDVDPANYSLKITGMKDATVRENALPETTLPFTALDTKEPEAGKYYLVTAGDSKDKDTITIYFTEAMNIASIETPANYLFNGMPLTADSNFKGIKAASDGKSVVITYNDARNFEGKIVVVAATDLAGNTFVDAKTPDITKLTDSTLAYEANTAKVTATKTVELTFNSTIISVDPAGFAVYNKTSGQIVSNFVAASISGSTVKLTTAVDLDADASQYVVRVLVPSAIKNIYGSTLNATANTEWTVQDKILPTLSKVEKAGDNQIKFTFSEKIKEENAGDFLKALLIKKTDDTVIGYASDFEDGATVTGDLANGTTTVTVEFAGDLLKSITGGSEGDYTIKVSFPTATGIKDCSKNPLKPVADQTVTFTAKKS